MASTSIACFSPQALARPTTRNPNPTTRKSSLPNRKSKSNFKPQNPAKKPHSLTVPGGEAPTYTRLPLREDFTAPSLDFTVAEVKLSESTLVEADNGEKFNLLEEEEEERVEDGNFQVDFGRAEVYEVNSDPEEDDSDEEFENGEVVNDYESYGFYEAVAIEEFNNEETGNQSDSESIEVKEKGVPAIMRCFDRAKIYARAGDGGNGVVAFRREKFVPLGGPSGGDGGRGGIVYVEVEKSMNSLLPFRNKVHYRAGRGSHGQGQMQNGAKGEDVVVKVPPGTVIREPGGEEVLLELLYPGERALLLPGGRGGRGNTAFKCGSNKVPRIAENGEEGAEM